MLNLNSILGNFFYRIIPNDYSWYFLSVKDRKKVIKENLKFNNDRPDYNVKKYQKGKYWGSNRSDDYRNWFKYIEKYLPKQVNSILEFGSGSGYYTKIILDYLKPKNVYLNEINIDFINFLKKKISSLKYIKKFKIFKSPYHILKIKNNIDLCLFLSSLHHIPDRDYYFKCLSKITNKGSKVIIIEPTHYFPRIYQVIKKFLFLYNKKNIDISTHHFLTVRELHKLSKKNKFRMINYEIIQLHPIIAKYSNIIKFLPKEILKYFSIEMIFILEKK